MKLTSVAAGTSALALLALPALAASADYSTDFTDVTIAETSDPAEWHMTGTYDAEIVTNENGDSALRISNATTSGSFGDQLFSPSLSEAADSAGEVFEASFVLDPVELQPGLRVTVSPDNGSGGRSGFLAIEHRADGLAIVTSGANGNAANWIDKTVAEGLDPTQSHTVRLRVERNGSAAANNDVFAVQVDDGPWVKNKTFEAYYRATGEENYGADTLLFRVSGPAAPESVDKGLLIDDVTISVV
jgi:hypothetical protein